MILGGPLSTEKLYYSGHFRSLLSKKYRDISDIYRVGAMVFVGEHKEARQRAAHIAPHLDEDDLAFLNFHLALSYTRTSQYKKAAHIIKKNLNWAQQERASASSRFLAFHGLGFFHWFFSKHQLSQRCVDQSQVHLMQWKNFPQFFQVLSLDLEGHNWIQLGQVHKGYQSHQKALQICAEADLLSFSRSLTFSSLLTECRFLIKPTEGLKKLQSAFAGLDSDDDYSRSELIFEISNLLQLMGRFKEAHEFLSDHLSTIYSNENKRQMGKLNFAMTHSMYLQGDFEQALYLAKTARNNLDELTDRGIICKILGLEIEILKCLNQPTETTLQQLQRLDEKIDSGLIHRRNARQTHDSFLVNSGEDPIGDLVDRLEREDNKLETFRSIVDKQALSLFFRYFKVIPGTEGIVMSGSFDEVIVFKKNQLDLNRNKLSGQLRKILMYLSDGPATKEELIKNVWGYNHYSPLTHDPLIYSSINRMKTQLNLDDRQLLFHEETYQLRVPLWRVKNKEISQKLPVRASSHAPVSQPSLSFDHANLNFRQIEFLNQMAKEERAISVKKYGQWFGITTMTALRDLKKLCDFGYLTPRGRGRATHYLMASNLNDKSS
ncbi:MAG: hypothetical protein KDD33_08820 [Bdellovibrionales bacterium]|nr:hypothetical protein [Bdellovibrionales bacterium]